jgi:hypothetical protein
VLIRDDLGNGNRFSLVMAQVSLQSVIGELGEERAQIEAIYHKFHDWLSCVFGDKRIEELLNSLRTSDSPTDGAEPGSSA